FFLLIGKLYQKKTFDSLSFERDYKSYFPISVMRLDNNKEEIIMVTDLNIGDRIIIHNRELIPADTKLISPQAEIDYSFVTGETTPIKKKCGETIFAGGKLSGPAVELEVIKNISQSYITQLWNNDAFDNNQSSILIPLSDKVSKYFTLTIITIAFLSALYWVLVDPSQAVNAATAVLIIACPCALALSTPFTLGTAMRILGKNKLYVKNSSVIEAIARTKSIIFDKTGTLTKPGETSIDFSGEPLSNYEKILIKSLVRHSTHPLSYNIYKQISGIKLLDVKSLYEEPGAGLEGIIDGNSVKIGSAKWINLKPSYYHSNRDSSSSRVYFSINNKVNGFFIIRNSYRDNLKSLISSLEQDYHLSLLSGDNTGERERLTSIFTNRAELLFEQSPYDKLEFVKKQQSEFKNVMMIGDGLNDTGALQQSDVGIAVCDSLNAFTPASDAIMDAEVFANLDKFIAFCKKSISIITISFAISFIFNIVGLSFAVRSLLSPLMAAVLMPLSSLSVVLFTTTATKWQAKRIGLK
ncbi:MAG: heavy metal translocating P-type ATPase, partial [Candidatus Zixiibacteriota bacterium]